jgi:hypothetical protein
VGYGWVAGRAWEQFTLKGIELLHDNDHAAMCRTDVASYYGSISLGSLASMLRNLRCESNALWLIVRVIGAWQRQDSQLGLPIGFEASSVLGNAFLKPVDDLIEKLGVVHLLSLLKIQSEPDFESSSENRHRIDVLR